MANNKQIAQAIENLSVLVQQIERGGVFGKPDWTAWRKENVALIDEALDYHRQDGMPESGVLVKPFFHPRLPLIGLNYTPVAHNTLHLFGERGWTWPLRLCRGIVFERSGRLVALPFPKFFNYGEHPETTREPFGPFEATVKHDGHLGIVFEYDGQWLITTRGTFGYRTAKLGQAMLEASAELKDWMDWLDPNVNPLVEIIHPETKVHLKYRKARLILIGANNRATYADANHLELRALGRLMGLEVTKRWTGTKLVELQKHIHDLTVRNREGFVVRMADGRRIKFKFKSYLSLMIGAKLSPHYIMNRMMNGSYEKLMADLDYEIQCQAARLVQEMCAAAGDVSVRPLKERRQRLYELLADPKSQYQRGICRKFLTWLDEDRRKRQQ